MISDSDTPPQVTMCMRGTVDNSTYERQEAVQDRLQALERTDRISDVSVRVWGKQIPASGDLLLESDTRSCIRLYDTFESWTEQVGSSLEPGFSRHSIDSLVADDQREVIRVPIIVLAAFDDGDVIDLAPRSTPDGNYTIDDFLAAVETQSGNPVEST